MHFQILPTTRCNARCFYCYELNQQYEDMNDEIIEKTIFFINSTVKDSDGNIYIDWFGGEPLLALNSIERIAKGIMRANPERQVIQTLVTNGSLINPSICERLQSINVNRIQITLDGCDECYLTRKNYYDKNISFSNIVKNIDLCIKKNFNVSIRINVDMNNIEECKALISLMNKQFASSLKVYVAPLYGNAKNYLNENNVYQVLKPLKNHISSTFSKRDNLWGTCLTKQNENIFIKPDGTIVRCEHMFANENAVIGNVQNGVFDKDKDVCLECQYLKICKQGCISSTDCNICWRNLY